MLESTIKISSQQQKDVSVWKRHYGMRSIGVTHESKMICNGLDVYKHTSACGYDLELLLIHLHNHDCVVDWLGFCKSATIEGWLISTILRKIKFPIMEVYGKEYWNEIEFRIKLWFIEFMKTQEKESIWTK
jgi:hypothetical protein